MEVLVDVVYGAALLGFVTFVAVAVVTATFAVVDLLTRRGKKQ